MYRKLYRLEGQICMLLKAQNGHKFIENYKWEGIG